MTKPYSNDLCERVVVTMQSGARCGSVAARFGIAPSNVVRWTQRAAQTGSLSPAQMGGYRRPILEPCRAWLLDRVDQVQARPHVTLSVLQEKMAERGIEVSHDTVWRFLRGCGFSFKKDIDCRRARMPRCEAPPGPDRPASPRVH
ncbi:hypothetical protein AB9K34_10290 [Sedimentitalea sp. XS_ASV28]|uniref:hypothetical protein n=1 Tax=Sedimentitalea sp. XS_ASV28 TaxID=3241296 RepID=UPI0035197F64